MRTDDFWAVIDRAIAEPPDSPDAVAKRAAAELATRDPQEIIAWDRHLGRVLAGSGTEDLWAAAYLINGGCSDDGFDAFRGWLIANGRSAVARAVIDPDSLAEVPEVRAAARNGAVFEAEEVLSIGVDAYMSAMGVEPPRSPAQQVRPDPAELWDFDDEDEMRRRLPRLSALFLEPPD